MTTKKEPTIKSEWHNWSRLVQFLVPYWFRFSLGILFALLNTGTNLLLFQGIPVILATIFPRSSDNGSSSLMPGISKGSETINQIISGMINFWNHVFGSEVSHGKVIATIVLVPVIMFLRAITDYLSNYYMSWVGVRIITDLRQKVFLHIQKLSLDFYNQSNVGDLISRLVNDCQQAQSGITTVIADAIKHPFTIIVFGWALLHQDFNFSIAAVVLAPVCALPIYIYGKKVRRTSKLSQENQGEILSRLHENITGVKVVKSFNMEEHEAKKFWETCYRQFGYQMRIVRSVNILNPMIEIVASIGVMAALFYAFRVQMEFGTLISLLFGMYTLYNPIKNLSKLHTTIQKSLAATDRVFAVLDSEPTVKEQPNAIELKPIHKGLRFENIDFSYDDHQVLHQIALDIPHGKTVALVGPSGGGKTTLLSLVLRFYDPAKGRVLVDEVNIKDVTFASLRKQIGIVTQDTILFNDTIHNNLCYGTLNATREQIINAAKQAYAHDFILQQPQGYETMVGDKGVKLSGGQKQRLAIARAILKNPAILLLDEATSALDSESERYIQKAFDELVKGRTVIVIAHRLSTVQNADLIVVIDKGRIVEQGKHDDLVKQNGLYRKLYDLQFAEV